LRPEEIVWVKDLDTAQKAEMLLDGRIDVMLTSIQNYIGKLEGDNRVHILARDDELIRYRERGPEVITSSNNKEVCWNGGVARI
jgi:hypothetical protein